MTDKKPRASVIRKADELRASAISVLKDFVGSKLGHLEFVVLALMARILEFHNSARILMDHSHEAPVAIAIITLARAQYESFLDLAYIFSRPSPEGRKKLAVDLMKFAEYEHVEAIGKDRLAYRAALDTDEKRKHFDRRIQSHDEVEKNLSPAQKKQKKRGKYVTWNGLSIAQTAKAVGVTGHEKWYDVMSKVAHSKPSMFHKSITKAQDGYVLGNVEKGEKDAIEWLQRMNRKLELAIQLVTTAKV